jgi:hypothetical protein
MKPVELRVKPPKGLCAAKGCKNETTGTLCSTHRSQQSRLKDPVKYAFHCKRHRAKEREIFWDLTLEQFRQFCYDTEYMDKKGQTLGSYNVDRIIEGKTPGYTVGNIQILEKSDNIRKYKKYDAETKRAVEVVETIVPAEDLPF